MLQWINPQNKLPLEKQKVLFKIIILKNSKIRYGRFILNKFQDLEWPAVTYFLEDIWGWFPFEDSNKRK